ncbi:class I SAM-dependent methyltransferase [Marinobacter sp. C2H3]|uniref:class I SAM-dependent methyltransferase n=1 Tax=Marinobacter sp. C2H3 TaxID=3119003 RepID=UPI00300EEA04
MSRPQPATQDDKVLNSWHKNASAWTQAIRSGSIESRKRVTDAAIIEAVLSLAPASVLDIGCGEGWLLRALAGRVRTRVGVDAVSELIDQAQSAGGGTFCTAAYDDIANGTLNQRFDVAVCNFSLIGKAPVDALFQGADRFLNPGGSLVVQTLHPLIAGEPPYTDGWRAGSWAGFGPAFKDPAPWYFRTLESWVRLFTGNGLALKEIREPVHPVTREAASVILIGRLEGHMSSI